MTRHLTLISTAPRRRPADSPAAFVILALIVLALAATVGYALVALGEQPCRGWP